VISESSAHTSARPVSRTSGNASRNEEKKTGTTRMGDTAMAANGTHYERAVQDAAAASGSGEVALQPVGGVDRKGLKRKIVWTVPSKRGRMLFLGLLALARRKDTTCDQVLRAVQATQNEIPTIGVDLLQSLSWQATNFNNIKLADALQEEYRRRGSS